MTRKGALFTGYMKKSWIFLTSGQMQNVDYFCLAYNQFAWVQWSCYANKHWHWGRQAVSRVVVSINTHKKPGTVRGWQENTGCTKHQSNSYTVTKRAFLGRISPYQSLYQSPALTVAALAKWAHFFSPCRQKEGSAACLPACLPFLLQSCSAQFFGRHCQKGT